jgi:RNA polymerase sigma factor (sigma-70 family)
MNVKKLCWSPMSCCCTAFPGLDRVDGSDGVRTLQRPIWDRIVNSAVAQSGVVQAPRLIRWGGMSTKPGKDTSLTLLERVQKFPADLEAWDEFVHRYQPMIRAWCVNWGLQDSDADDVAQDVLVKLLSAMRKFRYDPARSFHGWLKTVTHHALSNFCNDRRREPGQIGPDITIDELGDARVDLEHKLESLFDRDLFQMAMRRVEKRVKPVTWDAFRLSALDGLSGQEVAFRLQIPVANVFVAKNRVQKLLHEEIRIMKGDKT